MKYSSRFKLGSQCYLICELLEKSKMWMSTFSLYQYSGSLAPGTKASQIRQKGIPIEHKTEPHKKGGVIHYYRIKKA